MARKLSDVKQVLSITDKRCQCDFCLINPRHYELKVLLTTGSMNGPAYVVACDECAQKILANDNASFNGKPLPHP